LSGCLWVAALVIAPSFALAQAKPIKEQAVYLKVPHGAFQDKVSVWSGSSLFGTVEPVADGAAVNGKADWRLAAFPPLTEYKVKKIKTKATAGGMPSGPAEVELEGPFLKLKLSFPKGDTARLFPLIFADESDMEAYREETYRLLASKFFDGTPLAALTEEQKRALCRFADVTAKGTKMGAVTYKDNLYLLVDLGSDTNVYNDLKLNQAQRVAYVINERLLTVLKAFAMPVKDTKEVYGLKLEMVIPHRSFLRETAIPELDRLEIYAPAELVRKFSDADITSQQFIDGCVVIVENNRISVPLSSS
jgi:hypothetical protein